MSRPVTFFTLGVGENGRSSAITLPMDSAARNQIYWEVESSSDLASWTVIERQPTYAGPTDSPVEVIEPGSMAALDRLFLRLTLPGGGYAAQ